MDDVDERSVPDLRDYGRTVWRRRWVIVLTVVIFVGGAVALSAIQTPMYEASAEIIIQSRTTLGGTSVQQNAPDAARNVETETAVLKSRVVRDAAEAKLGHKPDVTISSNPSSDVVKVTARSTDAQQAATDANGYADAYVAFRRQQNIDDLVDAGAEIKAKIAAIDKRLPSLSPGSRELTTTEDQRAFLQQQLDQLQLTANLAPVGGTRVLARADVPTSPVTPNVARNVALALVVGLMLGVAFAFLRDYLDDTITSREDLERATGGLPVLAQISRIRGWRERDTPYIVSLDAPNSPASESYRTLRTAIQFLGVDRDLNSIQITSSQTDDGKTTTLANLGVSFARAGAKVTIVCCDLRHPRIHEFFGLHNDIGFTSVLLGEASVLDALQEVPGEPNLSILAAGPPPPNPSELLASAQARVVVADIEKNSDLVFVDSPPALLVSDALIVSGTVDATVLVASAKSSSRRALHRAVEVLRQVDAPLVGSVLNNAESAENFGSYGDAYLPSSSNGTGTRATRRQRRETARAERTR